MKKEYQDDFEKFIKEGFDRQAKKELDAVKNDESLEELPESLKISMRQKIDARIKEAEAAKAETQQVESQRVDSENAESEKSEGTKTTYDNLSEEDRKALELGRKMLEEGKVTEFREPEKKGLSSRGKLRLKHVLGFVAVLAVVMLVEVNSLGGPEKVVELMKQKVAEREVEQINASSDSKVIVEENEEEAYQVIADAFGVEPVRMRIYPEKMTFKELELDLKVQNAWMNYEYKGESIRYLISTLYQDTALGVDFEDELVDQYEVIEEKTEIQIKEYRTPKTGATYYWANYSYNGLEYYLFGKIEKEEFEKIINNLFFY